MKNSNDTIGNRTRDLPACSVVYIYLINARSMDISIRSIYIYIYIYSIHACIMDHVILMTLYQLGRLFRVK